MARPALIVQQLGGLVEVPDQDVETAVTVVVEDRKATAILDPVSPVDEGDVRERAIPVVAEEYLAFVAVEAVLADVEEGARAFVEASTDAFEHVHSDIVENGARYKAVHGIDVEEPVVVVVEELGAPAPLTIADAGAVADVGEGAVPVVVEERVPARELVKYLVRLSLDLRGEETK